MANCLALPIPPLPTLPFPLSISPPSLPDPPQLPGFCCKLPPIPYPPIPIHIPPLLLNPAVIVALKGYMKVALAYIHAKPLKCPLE